MAFNNDGRIEERERAIPGGLNSPQVEVASPPSRGIELNLPDVDEYETMPEETRVGNEIGLVVWMRVEHATYLRFNNVYRN